MKNETFRRFWDAYFDWKHKISPDERLLDPLSYQEARSQGNLGRAFLFPPLTGSAHKTWCFPFWK